MKRGWRLENSADWRRGHGRTVLRAKPRGSFLITTRPIQARRAHLVAETMTVWNSGAFVDLMGSARCGRILASAAVHFEVPDDVELCDDCALAGFPGAACVYRFYDSAGQVLYIGCTINLAARILGHAKSQQSSAWWPLADHWTYEAYDDHGEALRAEARAIVAEQPLYNRDLTDRAHRHGRKRSRYIHLLDATS